jgi:hypothetical protein
LENDDPYIITIIYELESSSKFINFRFLDFQFVDFRILNLGFRNIFCNIDLLYYLLLLLLALLLLLTYHHHYFIIIIFNFINFFSSSSLLLLIFEISDLMLSDCVSFLTYPNLFEMKDFVVVIVI